MAKDAKKTKTKAKINWGWNAPEERDGKATRSTSSKNTSSKNKIDITDDVSMTVSKKSKESKKSSLGFKAILIIVLVTLIGGAIGVGACWYVCRDDCFTIIGQDEQTLPMTTINYVAGEPIEVATSYVDEGVKVVSFGRDISKDVYIETDLKKNEDGSYYADEIGTYYIIYKTNDIKYGKIFTVERIRLITFVEGTPDNVVD